MFVIYSLISFACHLIFSHSLPLSLGVNGPLRFTVYVGDEHIWNAFKSSGESKGGARPLGPPPSPIFFHFHTVFSKKICGLAPLDPSLKTELFFVEDYYVADSTVLQEARMRDKSVCAVCNEKFKDEATAKTHLKSEHSEEEMQKPWVPRHTLNQNTQLRRYRNREYQDAS